MNPTDFTSSLRAGNVAIQYLDALVRVEMLDKEELLVVAAHAERIADECEHDAGLGDPVDDAAFVFAEAWVTFVRAVLCAKLTSRKE